MVFIGTVKQIDVVGDEIEINDKTFKINSYKVSFDVSEVLGGAFKTNETVYTGSITDSCSLGFKLGEKYLVYSYIDKKTKVHRTGKCSRTKKYDEAKNEIEIIKEYAEGKIVRNRIFGKVLTTAFDSNKGKYIGLADISNPNFKVLVRNKEDSVVFESAIDKFGVYDIQGFSNGKYEIVISKDNLEKITYPALMISKESQCKEIDFFLGEDDLEKWGIID